MSSVLESRAAGASSTTADDTLKQKSRDANVISGGHLVARALKNEGVDTIFTLCGGHIIDIYDGCIDEGIRIIDVRHEQVAAPPPPFPPAPAHVAQATSAPGEVLSGSNRAQVIVRKTPSAATAPATPAATEAK